MHFACLYEAGKEAVRYFDLGKYLFDRAISWIAHCKHLLCFTEKTYLVNINNGKEVLIMKGKLLLSVTHL